MSFDAGLTLRRELEREANLAQRRAHCPCTIRAIRRKASIAYARSWRLTHEFGPVAELWRLTKDRSA